MAGFLAFNAKFSSMTSDWNILSNVQIQNIYLHLGECTDINWGLLTLMVISLALVNSIHQWLVINSFLPCSTSKNLFTWLESYRLGLAWIPWAVRLHHYIFLSSVWGWRSFEFLTRIHIVSLVAMFNIWGWMTWIYSVCFVAMFHLLH